MAKVKNISVGLQHLPPAYAKPDAKGVRTSRVAPGETIEYDMDALLAARPGLAALYHGVFEVVSEPSAKPGPRAEKKASNPSAKPGPRAEKKASNPYAEIEESEAGELIADISADEAREWLAAETRESVIVKLREKID